MTNVARTGTGLRNDVAGNNPLSRPKLGHLVPLALLTYFEGASGSMTQAVLILSLSLGSILEPCLTLRMAEDIPATSGFAPTLGLHFKGTMSRR